MKNYLIILIFISTAAFGQSRGLVGDLSANYSSIIHVMLMGKEIEVKGKSTKGYIAHVVNMYDENHHDAAVLDVYIAVAAEGVYADMFRIKNTDKCQRAEWLDSDMIILFCDKKEHSIAISNREGRLSFVKR
ncbi:hypothetical protein [Teredinibacter purpureus]|uniref:hypothetical protein n=1 Tax=Teredinibacter purpureus TaxID=2731756 RepID=UPI0005F86379|nr:hypothetical protein [Teredinibacter purpureus]